MATRARGKAAKKPWRAILAASERYAKAKMGREGSHDHWHAWRVRTTALKLAKVTPGPLDRRVLELAALLHDVEDWKLSGDPLAGPRAVGRFLRRQGLDPGRAARVARAIEEVSFKGAGVATPVSSAEAALVQDADRLDALGAIGIARCFAYGGAKGRPLYEPGVKPSLHGSFRAYRKARGHSLNHFFEKLFLLKQRMNTAAARRLAARRHRDMERFVARFLREWKGAD